eukprot:TRINITY_DN11867_c0_g1_i2.p1 TRINITY_DN11867_c0_g1~~TRINITY_DN11867_c0_g1_i2.p1  ORF type:complete len:205 (+),score=20.79 TRINITY_DN11867_c0_g1_i2:221-835(+)
MMRGNGWIDVTCAFVMDMNAVHSQSYLVLSLLGQECWTERTCDSSILASSPSLSPSLPPSLPPLPLHTRTLPTQTTPTSMATPQISVSPGEVDTKALTTQVTRQAGIATYYINKIDELDVELREKIQNLRRLVAQRNALNAKGRIPHIIPHITISSPSHITISSIFLSLTPITRYSPFPPFSIPFLQHIFLSSLFSSLISLFVS